MNARLLALALLPVASGCVATQLVDTTEQATLFDAPATDDGVPDSVDAYLSSIDRALLEAVGLELHTGEDPPLIEGTFLLDSLVVEWDDDGADGWDVIETYVQFDQQRDDGALSCATWDDGASNSNGNQGYVSGSDGCFSAFIEQNYYSEDDECFVQMPMVWSGCVGPEGLEDLAFGFIAVEREGPCDTTVQEGHRRLIVEQDQLAATVTTS
jgi:hypothetical protein